MVEESQTQSIHARIAALNLGQVGRAPVTANGGKPVPEPRPSLDERPHSTSVPPTVQRHASSIGNEPNGPRKEGVLPPPANIILTGHEQAEKPKFKPAPPLRAPQSKDSTQLSPALPPRRPSDQLSRKASNDSVASTISAISTISNGTPKTYHARTPSMDAASRIKAPAYDAGSLPPLPPKRTKEDVEKRYKDIERSKAVPGHRDADRAKAALKTTKTTASMNAVEVAPPPALPALPPRRPSQPALPTRKATQDQAAPPMPARPSALTLGMNKSLQEHKTNGAEGRVPSPSPSRDGAAAAAAAPPPVPLSSRPDLSKFQSTKPQKLSQPQLPSRSSGSLSTCLLCRDFATPDAHAAKFPRQSVPSLDWLATQLTSPFPESHTDQARALFTWLHHNIAYDTVSFFSGNVQPSTPMSTLDSGLAVCEGYAGLFTALASKIGLESFVVGGHGKGFGHSALKHGELIPPESSNHAWNAVKIDGGEWKLIDTCWGAGHINGAGQPYTKKFSPRQFTMSNEDFGLRHFPSNRSHFFRSDGRQISWEDYFIGDRGGEALQVYSGVAESEGISETSFLPKYKKVAVSSSASAGPTIRFQFSRVCEHWDPIRNGPGKPYVFILAIHGVDGRKDDYLPFETNGIFWWVDVEPKKLGAPGQTVSAYTVESISGNSGRGLGIDEYRHAKGRKAMGFGGLAAWDLV